MAENKPSDTASGTKWDNPNHQLYLHHSDQPGAILVPQPLVEDNYSTWRQSMTMALTVKNKIGLVDGSIVEPNGQDPNEWQQWNRCNKLVQTWLLGSMSKDIASSVINCKNARQMWLELQERFSHVNVVQLFNIENEIHDCVQGSMSVGSYFTKLKGLWDERDALCTFPICTCGSVKEVAAYLDTQKTMKFLMGLSDSYASVRSNTLLQDPLPTVNKAYSLVLRHEKQSEVTANKAQAQPDAAVFAVKRSSHETEGEKGELKCTKCNKTNHTAKNCRAHLKCAFCGWKGHTADYCRKKKAAAAEADHGIVISKGNQAAACLTERKEMKFPFTAEECKQILSVLQSKSSSANHVGNSTTHEELSGPTFGDDDWDGN
ncbi:uncharacterized protein LOC126605314 [Malus sylvestris]|uniref:uncharacterized protein LOC126605314 n=1 Tax=Malus sylvestris TaxID=3752 RepID=UPI0021ACA707|nr:uncharacterized protein LOC126605314 [Malus sylvestris]